MTFPRYCDAIRNSAEASHGIFKRHVRCLREHAKGGFGIDKLLHRIEFSNSLGLKLLKTFFSSICMLLNHCQCPLFNFQ